MAHVSRSALPILAGDQAGSTSTGSSDCAQRVLTLSPPMTLLPVRVWGYCRAVAGQHLLTIFSTEDMGRWGLWERIHSLPSLWMLWACSLNALPVGRRNSAAGRAGLKPEMGRDAWEEHKVNSDLLFHWTCGFHKPYPLTPLKKVQLSSHSAGKQPSARKGNFSSRPVHFPSMLNLACRATLCNPKSSNY